MSALSALSAASVRVTCTICFSLCLLAVMRDAEPLHVVSVVCAACCASDDVVELSAQLDAAVDCAEPLLLVEDCEAQSTPCSC